MIVKLRNQFGIEKDVKVGFSWTNLFFSFLTPLFRGDFKWALLQFVTGFITSGLSIFVFPFFYNKEYIKDLISQGYRPINQVSNRLLISRGIYTGIDWNEDIEEVGEIEE